MSPAGRSAATSAIDVIEAGVYGDGGQRPQAPDAAAASRTSSTNYGPGRHLWPYWNRGLKQTLPAIMERFHRGSRPPARVTFKAAEPRYSAYGWSVSIERPGAEFSVLANAGRRGFALAGSGSATVTTPARYVAGRAYAVRVRGKLRRLTASARGRLRIAVPLGPWQPGAAVHRRRDHAGVHGRA